MGIWEFSFGQDLSELQPHLTALSALSMCRRFLTLAGGASASNPPVGLLNRLLAKPPGSYTSFEQTISSTRQPPITNTGPLCTGNSQVLVQV